MKEVQKRKIELDFNREISQTYFTRRTKINQLKTLEYKQKPGIINEKNRNEERKKEIEEKKVIAKEIYKDYYK